MKKLETWIGCHDNTVSDDLTYHQWTPPVNLSPISFIFIFFSTLSSSRLPPTTSPPSLACGWAVLIARQRMPRPTRAPDFGAGVAEEAGAPGLRSGLASLPRARPGGGDRAVSLACGQAEAPARSSRARDFGAGVAEDAGAGRGGEGARRRRQPERGEARGRAKAEAEAAGRCSWGTDAVRRQCAGPTQPDGSGSVRRILADESNPHLTRIFPLEPTQPTLNCIQTAVETGPTQPSSLQPPTKHTASHCTDRVFTWEDHRDGMGRTHFLPCLVRARTDSIPKLRGMESTSVNAVFIRFGFGHLLADPRHGGREGTGERADCSHGACEHVDVQRAAATARASVG